MARVHHTRCPGTEVSPPSDLSARRDIAAAGNGALNTDRNGLTEFPSDDIETTYRTLLDRVDQGVCIIEVLFDAAGQPSDYRFLRVNPAFVAQTGLQDAEGRTMRWFRPDHEQHWFEIYGRIALTGEPARFDNPAATLGRWYEVHAFRVGLPEQRRVAIVFNDIAERKRNEEKLSLYAQDMGHRAKNMLAVAAGMVQMTKAATVEDYKAALLGRINALAHSQRLLLEDGEERVDLARLFADEMSVHQAEGEGRIVWTGPGVRLEPGIAQSVVMAVHELATNATKYGALSAPEGRVTIEWQRPAAGQFHLCWTERGGPPVMSAPVRRGLGTGIVMKCAQNLFGEGTVDFDWQSEGLVCRFLIPIEDKSR